MIQVTAILNFGLTLCAILLAFCGVYVVADVQIYKSFLLNIVQDLMSIDVSWAMAPMDPDFKLVKIFERVFLAHVNDPLLI